MKKQILLLLLISITMVLESGAQIDDNWKARIEETLAPVADPSQPGVSAAIIKDGKVIFLQPNGLINHYNGKVADEHTLYQVDALSKQFTTLAFLHLIENGAINLSDDIRVYIPELPKYRAPITIDHVLNHTTGLNNYYVVNQLQGMHGSLAINNDDALRIIAAQDKLEHLPGSDFSFFDSRTESLLMAVIIARVSEISFPEYVKKNVFDPLQLKDATFIDDPETLRPNVALPYFSHDGNQGIISDANHIVGPSNLYISISDLANYYALFSPKNNAPLHEWVKSLDTPVRNSQGATYINGWGEMTIGRSYLHPERGVPMFWQFGIASAYGANVFRHPDQDVVALAIGNNNSYNGMYAMPLIEPIMRDHYKTPAAIDASFIKSITLPIDKINKWAGRYYNPSTGQLRQFEVRADTLRYLRGPNAISLLPIGERSFQAVMQSDDIMKFHFNEKDSNRYYDVVTFEGSDQRYKAIEQGFQPNKNTLESYTGTYINEELGQVLKLSVQDNQLVSDHHQNNRTTLTPIKDGVFISNTYALSAITFHSDNDVVTGFTIKAGGIEHLEFKRVNFLLKSNS